MAGAAGLLAAVLMLLSFPAAALVGGAKPADRAIARHVVLIVAERSLCTGVAIASDLALTAGHCVLSSGRYRLVTFEGGRRNAKNVAAVAPHPQFASRADAADSPDLALIKLARDPAPSLSPVPLSDRRALPSVGDRFIVAGFGLAAQGDQRSAGQLRAATLTVTDRPSSQQLSLVDPQKLGETAGLGVCNGDSGGPVLDEHDRTLFGIVSWTTRPDGEPLCGFVSGITPLARYRHWLLETATKLGSSLSAP
ncbi:MAG TPA: trypsin-like serine protease [Xanthobacteraceae bacterium]|jgi:secreted trypsin-like serine protease